MTISTAQWLAAPEKHRTLLVKINYLNEGEHTLYLSTSAFISLPGDAPANTPFDDFILEPPVFSKGISLFSQGTVASRSLLTLFAHDRLVPLFTGSVFKREITYLLGDKDWPLADFIVIAKQLGERVIANADEFSVEVRDPSLKLDNIIDTGFFSTGVNANKAKPLCIGEVLNIEPLLEDAANHKYCVNYGAVEDIVEVRDNGLAVGVTKNNSTGTFTLNQAPTGRITCDVKGAKPSSYLQYPTQIITWLLTTFSGEQPEGIGDLSSLPAYKVGIYQREPSTVRSVIDLLCQSVVGYHTYNRQGQFIAKTMPLIDAAATDAHLLTLDDILKEGAVLSRVIEPADKINVQYRLNYTHQADGLAGGVSESDRALFGQEYLTKTVVNAVSDNLGLLPVTRQTCLVLESDAALVANRLANMYSVKRFIHQIDALAVPFVFELGDQVKFFYDDFLLKTGREGIVVYLADNPVEGEVTVEIWS